MATRISLFLCINSLQYISTVHAADRPNILLLFPDEWRFDWADNFYLKDLQINTPTITSVIANGTRFINTLVGSPVCAPSRGCLATGKEYDYSGMPENMMDLPTNATTFYQLLQKNGYYTMVTGKDDLTKKTGVGVNGSYRAAQLGYSAQRRCLDKMAMLDEYPNIWDPYAAYLSTQNLYNTTFQCRNTSCCYNWPDNGPAFYECPQALQVPTEAYQDNWVTWNSLNLLENKPENQPWFMQINFVGPHPPFIILDKMNASVNNRSLPKAMDCDYATEDMDVVRRDYTSEVENLDTQFKTIIDKLVSMGEYENTVICISSDHGEMLGDFDNWQKSKPWISSSNVPLVCMGPGIVRGQIIDTYVTNMDLTGTFLDYTNTDKAENMTTESLRPFLNGTWSDDNNGYRKYVSSGLGNWRMAVNRINETVTWKFVCCQHQCPGRQFPNATMKGLTKLLFNLGNDPYEMNDVGSQYPGEMNHMQNLLPPGFCEHQNEVYMEWDFSLYT